ncbi:hypothetical protein YN1_1710 [Nanoarchaeota archaeon]
MSLLYIMEDIYNTLCTTDKGLENITLNEINNILNRYIEYKKVEKNNKVFIFFNSNFYERLKLLYLSRTIDNIYYKENNKYEKFLISNLYNRGYEIKKLGKIKTTVVSKILYYSNIKENEEIINLMDDGSFSIEEGLILKNIPTIFWRKREIIEYSDFIEKFENIKEKVKGKIYCINKDNNILNDIEKNSEKALVKDIIYFRRIDIEWLDLKFKEKSIDKIFTFRIKKDQKINIKDKYIFYHSDKILKNNGKLFLLLYNKEEKYEKIINNIKNYIIKYNLEISDKVNIYNNNKNLLLLSIQKI